jgi:anaerobic magnesium-protoporphyrin IX monomethyl ester cyclase
MGITLIRCSEVVGKGANALVTPPVGVAYLAASLRRAGHEVKIVDGAGEALNVLHHPDFLPADLFLRGLTLEEIVARIEPSHSRLIGISCMFSQDWPVNRRLIESVRAHFPKAIIVCGGEHISALPEFTLDSCSAVDFCVAGEGELPLLGLAGLAEKNSFSLAELNQIPGVYFRDSGGVIKSPKAARIKELDALPWPAWDLVPIERYLDSGFSFGVPRGRSMPIVATRGCPYACTFCSNPQMWGTNWISRSPKEVVDEIAHYAVAYKANNFDFYDLTAIVRKDWIMEFCRELETRNLKITYQLPSGTRSEAIDGEVAAALARTGCCHIVYAPESGSERMLKLVQKRIKMSSLMKSMRSSLESGLFVKMNIVIGFPGEKSGDFLQTLRFLAHSAWVGVHDAFVYTFSPYPGSQLFHELQKKGRIPELSDDYFFSLASYIRLSTAISYTNFISSPRLAFYRLFALTWFYSLSFLFFPFRTLRMLKNLGRKESDTRIEAFLKVLLFSSPGVRIFSAPDFVERKPD